MSGLVNPLKDQHFISFGEDEWAAGASEVLQKALNTVLAVDGKCSVMLTGGKTAHELYSNWSELDSFKSIENVNFYYCDERCVPMNSQNSNYALSMGTLFSAGIPKFCQVFPMYHDGDNPEVAAANYEKQLAGAIDILILAFGEDGHIASIFPEMLPLTKVGQLVIASYSKNHPFTRITITPEVINKARSIFVIAKGKSKGNVILRMFSETVKTLNIPLRLVKNATWIIDNKALSEIMEVI